MKGDMPNNQKKTLSKEQKDRIKRKVKETGSTSIRDTFNRVSDYLHMSKNTFRTHVQNDAVLWEELCELYNQNAMIAGSKSTRYMIDVMEKVGVPDEIDEDTAHGVRIAADIAKVLSNKSDKVVERQERLKRITEERDALKKENDELKHTVKKITNGDGVGGMPSHIMLVPVIGDYTAWHEGFKMQQEALLKEMTDMMERDLREMG
jgi:hypothetical protein